MLAVTKRPAPVVRFVCVLLGLACCAAIVPAIAQAPSPAAPPDVLAEKLQSLAQQMSAIGPTRHQVEFNMGNARQSVEMDFELQPISFKSCDIQFRHRGRAGGVPSEVIVTVPLSKIDMVQTFTGPKSEASRRINPQLQPKFSPDLPVAAFFTLSGEKAISTPPAMAHFIVLEFREAAAAQKFAQTLHQAAALCKK